MSEVDLPNEGTMTFWQHLEELRSRVIKSMVAVMIGFAVAWYFKVELLDLLAEPYVEGWRQSGLGKGSDGTVPLHNPGPTNLFVAYIKIALLGGFLAALPVVLYQLWAFVAPGLYKQEKRFAIPFVVASCGLFVGGATFGAKVVFPLAFRFFLELSLPAEGSTIAIQNTMMIDEYLEFVLRALVAFGVVFEIPVVIFFLSVAGIVNHTHLIKFFRYFVVIAFILAAVITPPDIISQLLLAGPLILLYSISIGIARIFGRKPAPPAPTPSP